MAQTVEEAKKRAARKKGRETLLPRRGLYKKGCKEKREGNLAPQEGALIRNNSYQNLYGDLPVFRNHLLMSILS